MSSASVKSIWYGMLETKKGSSVVLKDDGLPEPLQGRVYLYNADRDKIIEYVEAIVGDKLRELDTEEIKALGKETDKKYKAARKQFLAENKSSGTVLNLQSESEVKPASKSLEEEVESINEDDMSDELDEIDEGIDWEDEEDEEKSA